MFYWTGPGAPCAPRAPFAISEAISGARSAKTLAAAVPVRAAAQAAYAHTTVEARIYSIEAGWGTEPPVVSYRNAPVFRVTEPGDSRGVPHAFRSMEAYVAFGAPPSGRTSRPTGGRAATLPASCRQAPARTLRIEEELSGKPMERSVPVERTAVLDFPPRASEIGP